MKTKLATVLFVGLLAGVSTGLAQNDPAQDENVRKLYNVAAPTPSPTAATTEAAAPVEAGEMLPLVQFEDAPLVDVIKTLARQASLNIIFDPKVITAGPDGKPLYPPVSIRLENVTAQNVLEAVLNNNNLRLERDPKTKISRITVKDPTVAEPLTTRIFQLRYTSPSNLVTVIKPTISARSQVISDNRTSQLIVMATEKEVLEIESLITRLDLATRQVLIEARILETFRNPSTVKGINWAGTFESQTVSFGNNTYTPDAKNSNNPLVPGPDQGPALIFDSARTRYTGSPATAFLDAKGVYAVMSFFNKDTDTEIVATPRAVTTDNTPATLSVTRAIPIFRVTTGGTQTGPTVDISYTNLGTILEVTPRISANSNITLKVVPEVSNVEAVDKQILNGEEQTANIYAIRRMQTQVLIPSGHTLVLGGLISDSMEKERTKVPILGDLPGMKYVFGSDKKARRKANLLIFVTPTIVTDADFQPTETTFFQRSMPKDVPDSDMKPFDTPWNSPEPYDWSKERY